MQNLKKNIAFVFVQMLNETTLDKITVTDIVKKCGVSRQAFYYHFKDVYDIIEWIFQESSAHILNSHYTIGTWQTCFVSILNWALKHKKLVMNTYHSIPREYVETFIHSLLSPYIQRMVDHESMGLHIAPEQKSFITRFYTLSFTAVGLDWIRNGMQDDPSFTASMIDAIIHGDFCKALKNFHNINETSK